MTVLKTYHEYNKELNAIIKYVYMRIKMLHKVELLVVKLVMILVIILNIQKYFAQSLALSQNFRPYFSFNILKCT